MRGGERGLQGGDLPAPLALLVRELGGELADDAARCVGRRCRLAADSGRGCSRSCSMRAPRVSCEMSTRYGVLCQSDSADDNEKATLGKNGALHACRWTGGGGENPCDLGNPGEGTPT